MGEWIDDATLSRIERDHPDGITSAEILAIFEANSVKLSEATLRKYVQLGLLPRSVRVGRKGKHQGSTGMYPAGVVRQILRIKEMLASELTIEQIQREFLFARGDIEELQRLLAKIFDSLSDVAKARREHGVGKVVAGDIAGARALAKDLLARLEAIEARLTATAVLARSATG